MSKKKGKEKDFKMNELDVFASEGNHCRQRPKEVNSNVYQFEAISQKYQNNVFIPYELLKEQLERDIYFEEAFCHNYGTWKFMKLTKSGKATTI